MLQSSFLLLFYVSFYPLYPLGDVLPMLKIFRFCLPHLTRISDLTLPNLFRWYSDFGSFFVLGVVWPYRKNLKLKKTNKQCRRVYIPPSKQQQHNTSTIQSIYLSFDMLHHTLVLWLLLCFFSQLAFKSVVFGTPVHPIHIPPFHTIILSILVLFDHFLHHMVSSQYNHSLFQLLLFRFWSLLSSSSPFTSVTLSPQSHLLQSHCHLSHIGIHPPHHPPHARIISNEAIRTRYESDWLLKALERGWLRNRF